MKAALEQGLAAEIASGGVKEIRGMGLMLAFVIGQGLFLAKYVEQKEPE